MAQELKLRVKGLVTNPNLLIPEVADGALIWADNVEILKENIVESRRGFNKHGFTYLNLESTTNFINKLYEYKDKLLVNFGTYMAYDENDDGEWTYYKSAVRDTFTDADVNIGSDTITVSGHPFTDDDCVCIESSGTLPAPIQDFETYYIINSTTDTVQIAYSKGGDPIDIETVGSGTFNISKLKTFNAPDANTKIRAVESNRNFYITTDVGIQYIDSVSADFKPAGIPSALDGYGSVSGIGWFDDKKVVAYRMIWTYKDANTNLVRSAPSSRVTVINDSGSDTNVKLTFLIPDGVTTDYSYKIYRSLMTEEISGDTIPTPTDELQLVIEGKPVAGEITAGEFTVLDTLPESLRGEALYTNTGQEGIENANYQPPFAKDMTTYKDCVFYGNTKSKHKLTVSLVGIGASAFNMGDSVTIDGVIYTAGAVESYAGNQFAVGSYGETFASGAVNTGTDTITISNHGLLNGDTVNLYSFDGTLPEPLTPTTTYYVENTSTSSFQLGTTSASGSPIHFTTQGSGDMHICVLGTPSVNIEKTAQSLVRVVNRSTSNDSIYAYYMSGFDEVPGKIMFEERTLGGSEFYMTASAHGDSFNPTLPTSGTEVKSDNDARLNRIYISKPKQPWAVPLYASIDVGSADLPIKRIIGLRDSVFVFKDDGIFRIVGEDLSSFRVSLFDNNVTLLAPESAVAFNNTIFMMTLQGVVSVSDTGVPVVSRAIEIDLKELIMHPKFNDTTFGVSYESDRKYILWTVSTASDQYPTQAFVYNSFTNSWTKWSISATCAHVKRADDRLYYGSKGLSQTQEYVYKERKSWTTDDYVDDEWETQIEEFIDSTHIKLSSLDFVTIGYGIRQVMASDGTKMFATIESYDSGTRIVTVDTPQNWSDNPTNLTTIYKPITCRVKTAPISGGNPGIMKQFREAVFSFRQRSGVDLEIGYETDLVPDYQGISVATKNTGLWGTFGWGTYPWGGLGQTFAQSVPVGIPARKQKCHWIMFSVESSGAFSSFSLSGISVMFEPLSEKFRYRSR